MKTTNTFCAGLIALLLFGAAVAASAATIALTNTDAIGTSSFNTGLNWAGGLAPTSGNAYVTAAFSLRTPPTSSNYTFAGDSLSMDAGAMLNYKGTATSTITITNLILNGGGIGAGVNGMNGTIAGAITMPTNSWIDVASASQTDARTLVIAAPIGGNGGLTVTNSGAASTNGVAILASTNSFAGPLTVAIGTLRLGAGAVLSSTGGVTVSGASAAANILGNYTNFGGGVSMDSGGTMSFAGTGLLALASAPASIAGSARLVVGNASAGTFNMTGGSLLLTNGYGVIVGKNAGSVGTFNMSDGSLMMTNTGSTNGGFMVGYAGGAGTVNVTGGTLSIGYGGGRVFIGGGENGGPYGTGTLTIANSGAVNIAPAGLFPNEKLYLAGYGGKGTINLNGGSLTSAREIALGGGGPAIFVFNGGTLRSGFSSSTFLNSNLTVTDNPGGAIIDTAGFSNTIAAAILNGGGGLTKIGAGILTLSNVGSTFTGNVVVAAGTLVPSVGNNLAAPANTAMGAVTGVSGRVIAVNSNATLRFAANDILGNAASSPSPTLVITNGGQVIISNNFTTLGPVLLSGGSLLGYGGVSTSFQQYCFASSVTVTGNAVSIIGTLGGTYNADHLSTNTTFNVADVTGDASPDLIVTAPLVNQNATLNSAPGSLTKIGNGTMRLDTNNTFAGTAYVNGGTLALAPNGTISNATVKLGAGGTFDVSAIAIATGSYKPPAGENIQGAGTVVGNIYLANAAPLVLPGTPGAPGTLTMENGFLQSPSYTNYFDLTNDVTVGSGVNDLLVVGENFDPAGASVYINPLAPLISGTYRLINYGSSTETNFNTTVLGNTSRDTWTLDTSISTQVNLIVSAGTNQVLVWSPQASATPGND